MRYLYTILKEDIGKGKIPVSFCEYCGYKKLVNIQDVIGNIQPQDVGKRVYKTYRGTIQVENQEQLETRRQKF
jgi:hypothetical protein